MKTIVLAIALFFLCVTVVFIDQRTSVETIDETHPVARAHLVTNAVNWLMDFPVPFTDPGIVWILSQLYRTHCTENADLARAIKERFATFLDHPIEYQYAPLIDQTATTTLAGDQDSIRFDDLLLPAIYCDRVPPADVHRELVAAAARHEGYYRTHAFLALLLMNDRHCLGAADKIWLDQVAIDVARDQNQEQEFGDLYAERVAFLRYGGYEHLIAPTWLDTIAAAVEADGGFATEQGSEFFGVGSNPHTTALAAWALSFDMTTCPFTSPQ